jgi:hypothetical protein
MRLVPHRVWAALVLLLVTTLPAAAASPVPVTIGRSRDGVLWDLQRIVDKAFGPGRIDVRNDYIGAHADDPDPWVWSAVPGKGIMMTLVAKKHPNGTLGWYREQGSVPPLNGFADGVVLERSRLRAVPTALKLPSSVREFGFYVQREPGSTYIDGDGAANAYFSNRRYNDVGAHGAGAAHAPYDGDVQMLVYDIGRLTSPNTWLVAVEYSDTGDPTGTGDGQSDNDFSDFVFTVSGVGVTPTLSTSFGRLKALYR